MALAYWWTLIYLKWIYEIHIFVLLLYILSKWTIIAVIYSTKAVEKIRPEKNLKKIFWLLSDCTIIGYMCQLVLKVHMLGVILKEEGQGGGLLKLGNACPKWRPLDFPGAHPPLSNAVLTVWLLLLASPRQTSYSQNLYLSVFAVGRQEFHCFILDISLTLLFLFCFVWVMPVAVIAM